MKFKKYSTAADTYTTLPATFQTSGAGVENYQVYGASSGVGEETENIAPTFSDAILGDKITFTVLSDNSVKINGSDASASFYGTQMRLAEGTYSMKSFIPIAGGMTSIRVDIRKNTPNGVVISNAVDNDNGITFTVDSTAASETLYFVIRVAANYVCDNIILKPTLVTGSTIPTSFIPKGYKIPILNTSGIVSENEFPYAEAGTFALGTGSVVSDGKGSFSIDVSNLSANTYSDYIPLKQNYTIPQSKDTGGEYIFYLGNSSDSIGLFIEFLDSNKIHIEEWQCATSWRKSTAYSNMTGSTIAYIRFYVKAGFIIQMTMSPMFSKNSNLTSYVPHFQQSNYDLFLGDTKLYEDEYVDFETQKVYKQIALSEPLRAIGNYKDTLDLSTGVITRRIKEYTFTGEEQGWAKAEASDHNFSYFKLLLDEFYYGVNNVLMCSHFVQTTISSSTSTIGINVYSTQAMGGFGVGLRTDDVSNTSLSDFKTWLALQYANNTPIKLWVVLATAETESVPVTPGLTGIIEGYLIQDGTPTQTNPIYPTANDIVLQPTDPPVPFPTISTYQGENNISVDTQVQPEKVVLTVKAWREIEAKKYVNGSWTDIVVRRYENGAWVPSPIPENNIANLQGLLTLLEDHWLPGVNDYRSMILVRTNRNDDTANQLCYMLTCYSTNPSPHFASEFLNNRYWLNDYAVPYSGTDFYLRKFSWSQGGGWVYDGYEDNKRDDYFVPIDSNTYNVYLLRIGSSTQYDNNAGYQYFYDLSAYF